MSGTAEGWFTFPMLFPVRYPRQTHAAVRDLSAERGGDELKYISGFTEMIHKGTENGYIEFKKHMEEQVPKLCLVTRHLRHTRVCLVACKRFCQDSPKS